MSKKPPIVKFAQKRRFDYDLPKGKSTSDTYNIRGYPTHCIMDQEGNIAYFKTGYSPQTASDLKAVIERLLKK